MFPNENSQKSNILCAGFHNLEVSKDTSGVLLFFVIYVHVIVSNNTGFLSIDSLLFLLAIGKNLGIILNINAPADNQQF